MRGPDKELRESVTGAGSGGGDGQQAAGDRVAMACAGSGATMDVAGTDSNTIVCNVGL